MNVKNRNSYYLTVTLLWVLSIFSSSVYSATVQVRVSSNNDDAEERIRDGEMYRISTDLEFGYDDYRETYRDYDGLQIVGIRFKELDIPQGAIINSAYIEFIADKAEHKSTNLIIFGEDKDSSDGFSVTNHNISNRVKTSASVNWNPSRWKNKTQVSTSDIRTIIQEIVDRAGWEAKNNLVLIVEPGSGCTDSDCLRRAESHNGSSSKAPLLVVDYTVTPTLKTPIFSPSDSKGILGGRLNGVNFHIGKVGNEGNKWPSNEGPEHLIDGVGQKYLNFGKKNTGAIITPGIGCSIVDTIKFWTANDAIGRDPASYELYGTNKSIDLTKDKYSISDFTPLSNGNLTLPVSRNLNGERPLDDSNSQTILFKNIKSYTSYLLYFPSIKENSANSMQLGEVQVFGSTCSDPTPVIDHYEIIHDGQGLTCEAEEVTINACINNYGTCVLSGEPLISLSVKTTGSRVVTVPVSSTGLGTGKAYIPYTIKDNTSLSLLGTLLPTVCFDGSTTSCSLNFANTGFQFTSSINSNRIPMQLSGKPSYEGYNASTLSLQAIKTNPVSGACEAALIGPTQIELVAECIDPAVCKGQNVVINGSPIKTLNSVDSPSLYTPVNVVFGNATSNAADFNLTYPDAGKVQLHARYNIPVDGTPSGDYMQGSSNSFVVRPFGFYIEADENENAVDANGKAYKKAGEKFTTRVTAVQWKKDQDNNPKDGIPDRGIDLSENDKTPNFGQEITPETVALTHELVAPSDDTSSSGRLSGGDITSFIDGVGKTNLSWSEVGIISLTANLSSSSYLDAGAITGTIPYVGRFIPAYFKQTIKATSGNVLGDEGSLTVNHNNDVSECRKVDWAYSGQLTDLGSGVQGSIRYSTPPKLTITAYNNADQITTNYTGDFAKLMDLKDDANNKIIFKTPHSDDLPLTRSFSELGVIDDLGHGVLTYQLSAQDHFVYTRDKNSKVAPFQAAFELPFETFQDSDEVTFKVSGAGIDYFENPKFHGTSDFNNTVEIRFGRLVLKNSFGPETSDLAQPMQIEYFDGNTFDDNNFVISADDNCASYDAYDILLTKITLDPAVTKVLGGKGDFIAGETRVIQLEAPGVGNKGDIGVSYDAPEWLKYNWDEDMTNWGKDNPFSVATFGFFRGNDRVIYKRRLN